MTTADLRAWFAGHLPDDWFTGPVDITFDRDEILVVGDLAPPRIDDETDAEAAAHARVDAFRETTRDARMAIADRAQRRFLRHVSWAATCDGVRHDFTRASVPVMTRLHMDDRTVLDTLVDAGVARSRSEALAWCVRLVAENEATWMSRLREAMEAVTEVREEGPHSRSDS